MDSEDKIKLRGGCPFHYSRRDKWG